MLERTVAVDPSWGPEGDMRSRGAPSVIFKIPKCTSYLGIGLAVVLLLTAACTQGTAPSPIIVVATPTLSSGAGSSQDSQSSGGNPTPAPIIIVATLTHTGAQKANEQSDVQSQSPELKDWTPRQHAAADKAIQEAYRVFAKDLDECINEIGEPDGGPFKDDLSRYEAAVTQSPYLECIQRKLSQN